MTSREASNILQMVWGRRTLGRPRPAPTSYMRGWGSHASRGKQQTSPNIPRRLLTTNTHRYLPVLITYSLMSHSHLTATSSNFQVIINNALKAYEKCTKRDLLTHPLASQIQACDSPSAILTILQQQVQGLDQSRSGDNRWIKWLDPTVKVLYVFSSTLEERFALVSLGTRSCPRPTLSYICGRYYHLQK